MASVKWIFTWERVGRQDVNWGMGDERKKRLKMARRVIERGETRRIEREKNGGRRYITTDRTLQRESVEREEKRRE